MHVHRSNRTEALVDILAEVVAQPAGDAAAPECIVVQGKGMERWLSMQLAQRFGVWANPLFPFPRKLIERAITAVLGPEGEPSACFEPETLMWAVAELLPAHLQRPEFAPIRTYLADDERGTKRIALAQRIADTFDQYVVYRPQMVIEWERGAGTDWQAVLWRALVARHGATHVAARAAAFLTAVPSTPPRDFPSRISLFGISALPPLHLQLLAALSTHVEVHLFVLSPSREYWADIQSHRQAIRAQARRGVSIDTLHLTEGHPLLASLGRLGRDFQQVLEVAGDYEEPDADLYRDPGTGNMLATLQSLGVMPSFSRPAVSNDNPYSESLFKTLKYRPDYPAKPFADLAAARVWVDGFVRWYNHEHRHSAICFVTPAQRHAGLDAALLQQRKGVYEAAKAKHP